MNNPPQTPSDRPDDAPGLPKSAGATPGPWLIRRFGRIDYVMDAVPDDEHGRCVANIIAGPNTNPCWEANARLICAAPDLLAAAEAAYSAIEYEYGKDGHALCASMTMYEPCRLLRAAVAKARQA